MPECVHAYAAGKLADESAFPVIDAFRDADDKIVDGLERPAHIFDKSVRVERGLRQIDEHGVVSLEFSGKYAGSSQPSGVPPHDFHDCHGFFIVIHGCVDGDLSHGRSDIFCRAPESGRVVCEDEVVVDRLRNTDETDLASGLLCIP